MTDPRLPNWVANADEPCWHVPAHGRDVLVAVCGHRIHGPVDASRHPHPPSQDGRSPCTDCVIRTGLEPTRRRRTFEIAMAALNPGTVYPANATHPGGLSRHEEYAVIRPHL